MGKIFIMGPSGIGKTTLAEYISKRRRIPFEIGSSKVLWEKYNIKNHEDLLNLEPDVSLKFQYELLDIRRDISINNPNFVSDRSVVDNAVYFLMQCSPFLDEGKCQEYINTCQFDINQALKDPANKFIYLSVPKEGYEIENDGMRINNLYYQDWLTGSIFDRLIKDKLLTNKFNYNNFLVIDEWDWEARVKMVDTFLDESPWERFCNKVRNFIFL